MRVLVARPAVVRAPAVPPATPGRVVRAGPVVLVLTVLWVWVRSVLRALPAAMVVRAVRAVLPGPAVCAVMVARAVPAVWVAGVVMGR